MTPDLVMKNLALYSAQVAILIAICGALVCALRLRAPSARLAFWQIVLAVCIALPFLQSRQTPPIAAGAQVTSSSVVLGAGTGATPGALNISWMEIALGVVVCGAIARLAWLAFGFLRLRRYRRAAEALHPLPDAIADSCASLCTFPEMLISDDVVSPVTFGLRRPTVLLPRGFLDLAPGAQRTIVCHEALHVRRRDWGFTVAEEIVRALLWFHPAVWWLLGQLQLAREQAVDSAVVEHTRSRDEYLGALLAIASGRYQPDLATATLFLKKRSLRERVAAMTKGVAMSKERIVVSMIAALAALPVAVALVAWQLPLIAAPQVVGAPDASGVEVIAGPYKLLHRSGVQYPAEEAAKGIGGDVVVTLTVDSEGEVIDARVVSGPEPLRKPVLQAVLGWHFATEPPLPSTFDITVRFTAKGAGGAQTPARTRSHLTAPPPGAVKRLTVTNIDVSQVPETLRPSVDQNLSLHVGDVIDWPRWQQIVAALQATDEHLDMAGAISEDKYVALRVFLRPSGAEAPTASESNNKPIKLLASVLQEKILHKVVPVYPAEAKQQKVQGLVRLKCVIGTDGGVKELTLVSGDPLLVPAAMDAVKQWVYTPTLLNGAPVEVMTQIDINFTLKDAPVAPQK